MTSNVRTDLVIDPNGDIWTDARIQRYLNEFIAQVYTWTGLDFAELSATLTLVAGTATYDLDTLSNYGKLSTIRLAGRYNALTEANRFDLENTVDLTTSGEPINYYLYGDNTIGLWPVPDGVIASANVLYERSAPVLTSGESPAFESAWHPVCEKYARWQALATQPGFETQAELARQAFRIDEAKMKDDLWERETAGRIIQNEIQTNQWPA